MSEPVATNEDNYGYTPSLVVAVIFIALYGVSLVAHSFQTFMKRSPRWMSVMIAACVLEVVGWGGRIWSREEPAKDGFIQQIVCLVIAPTFISAALYMLLGLLIGLVAPDASPLRAKKFKIIFITADIFSLVVQAVGGGLAATATTNSMGDAGSNIMLAGIVIQLVVMIFYSAYGIYWGIRSRKQWSAAPRALKWLVVGMVLSSLGVLIRGGYRTAELAEGFDGALAHNQTLFLLDAIPITISTLALNVWHPGRLLPGAKDPYSHEMTSAQGLNFTKSEGTIV